MKTDGLPPTDERHPYGATFPVYAVGMQVIARRASLRGRLTHLAASAPKRECAAYGFGGLHTRLHVQIAHQSRIFGFERVVQCMMQLNTVLLALLPAVGTDRVEHCCKLAARFSKCGGLDWRGLKWYAYRALHMKSMPYIPLF